MATRKDLLAMVHLGANRLGLGEAGYQNWLEKHTGKRSCNDLGNAEMERLVTMLRKLGALLRPAPKPPGGTGPDRPTAEQWRTAEGMACKLGMTGLDDPGFAGFVRRVAKVDTPRFLTREGMSKVILGMSRWIAQRAKKTA